MIQHFHQVIYCSERKRRAFFREITVGPVNAMVTNVEKLPPNYDIPYEQMRDQNEAILRYAGEIKYSEGTRGCPFCQNENVFTCFCSTMSCIKRKAKSHLCPGCQEIFNVSDAKYAEMSQSGFLHGEKRLGGSQQKEEWGIARKDVRQALPPRNPPSPPRELDGPVGSRKLSGRMKMKKYLEEKKKFQIEDKRDRG